MACLPDEKILAYLDGEFKNIEQAMIRDHLLTCPACRKTSERYAELHKILEKPLFSEPPAGLIEQVMKRIYPEIPKYTSIAALIAASFVFLVSWIYIYFDFSGNSLIQALRLTAKSTSSWLIDLIKGISTVYTSVYAAFKAGSAFLGMLLNTRLSGTWFVAITLTLAGLMLFTLVRLLRRKPREENK